jgi:hypothetical protein
MSGSPLQSSIQLFLSWKLIMLSEEKLWNSLEPFVNIAIVLSITVENATAKRFYLQKIKIR